MFLNPTVNKKGAVLAIFIAKRNALRYFGHFFIHFMKFYK